MSTPDSSASARTETTPHEQRECRSCNGFGLVLLDAEYDFESGELVQESTTCFTCRGSGSVYVYGPRSRR